MSTRSTRSTGTTTAAAAMSDSSVDLNQQSAGGQAHGAAAASSVLPPPATAAAATAAAGSSRRSTRAAAARATDRIHTDNKSNKSAVSAIGEEKQMTTASAEGSGGAAVASDAASAAFSTRPTRAIQHAAPAAATAAAATPAASPRKAKATAATSSSRSSNRVKTAGDKRSRSAAAAAASDEEEVDSDAAADGAGVQTAASRSRKKPKVVASSAPATKRARAVASKSAKKPRAASAGAAASSSRPRKRARGRSAAAAADSEEEEAQQSEAEEKEEEDEEEVQWEEWEEEEKEEDEEEDDEDAWLPSDRREDGAVEARARRKASKSKAATSRASPLRLVDLIDVNTTDRNELNVRRAVMLAAMQCDDEQIAASLNERSSKTGSTFLQAAFFALAQTENVKGVGAARHKFVKVLSDHMDALDIDAVNNAGQALVHIACSPTTYTLKQRRKIRYGWYHQQLHPDEPEYDEWERNFPVQRTFAVKVLQQLARAGVNFNLPDENGFIPVLGLARLAADSPALVDFIMQMALTRRRAQIPFSLNHVEKETGDSVLHLMWADSGEHYGWGSPAVLRDAQRLAGESRLLERLDLLAVNDKQETPLMRLAALVFKQKPREHWYPSRHVDPVPEWITALPTFFLRSWQAARLPQYKSVVDEFLIPDVSELCCEYVVGPKVRAGHPLSAAEQRILFGELKAKKTPSESGEDDADGAGEQKYEDGAEHDGEADVPQLHLPLPAPSPPPPPPQLPVSDDESSPDVEEGPVPMV